MRFCNSLLLLSILSASGQEVRFNRDVRPILSQNCFACHGFDAKERKANLRLDIPDSISKPAESGAIAIVPGKVEESEAWKRIISTDPDDVMPPPKHHAPLGDKERQVIKRWIEQGAKYEGHWAFVKPSAPASAKLSQEIDQHIERTLKEKGMTFSPPANRSNLLRRLSLDLTGLPPSPDEVNAFENNTDPDAYEKAVDRLLVSPHFGERMAQPWLDAARYADTNGYSIDGGRHAWLWRDWVIKAYNDNMPYDEFLTKQLAGDLLPDATDNDRIATAFQRNHSITHEGGTIPEENLTNYAADRVKTYGEAVLGLTLACAQCHDHKYDPITQKDYYQVFAFFNQLDDKGLDGDGGNNAAPSIRATSPLSSAAEIDEVSQAIKVAEAELAAPQPEQQAHWEQQHRNLRKTSGENLKTALCEAIAVTSPNGSPDQRKIAADHAVQILGGFYAAYTVTTKLPQDLKSISGIRVIFEPAAHRKNLLGYHEGTFVMTTANFIASTFPAGNVDPNSPLPVARITASDQRDGFPVSALWTSDTLTGWSPPPGAACHATWTFKKPISPSETPYLTAELVFNHGRGKNPAQFRIVAISGTTDDSELPAGINQIIHTPEEQRTEPDRTTLKNYFQQHSEHTAPLRHRLTNLRERLHVLQGQHPILVMNQSKNPRKTHILERGVYSAPAAEVFPGTPSFLPEMKPRAAQADRLDLARWTVSRDNPLTARVAVNRIWEIAFGRGLSTSTADFGSQGTWPTHPELLDSLAVHFMDQGWNVKQLLKAIVMTRTYQQSSQTTAASMENDPLNEWLGRGARFRLSAEAIRDQALHASGLLVPRIGGPSVKIYQPGDLWRAVSHYGSTPATAQTFIQDHGEKLYRRSIYTYWKRTLPPTNLSTFDAPNREVCTVGRINTNTPLQALVLLNDPQFVEAARHFAARMIRHSADDTARLRFGFQCITSRQPNEKELGILSDALAKEREKFSANPQLAQPYLASGESPIDASIPPDIHAAWTATAQLLLNLSEAITRN